MWNVIAIDDSGEGHRVNSQPYDEDQVVMLLESIQAEVMACILFRAEGTEASIREKCILQLGD